MDAPLKEKFSSCTPAELRELYETDPDRFRELAADAIRDACIGKTDAQTLKLRQMQWVIEGQLRKQKTPQQKLQEMQNIFYGRLYGDDGLIFRLNSVCLSLRQALKETYGSECGRPVQRVVTPEGDAAR